MSHTRVKPVGIQRTVVCIGALLMHTVADAYNKRAFMIPTVGCMNLEGLLHQHPERLIVEAASTLNQCSCSTMQPLALVQTASDRLHSIQCPTHPVPGGLATISS